MRKEEQMLDMLDPILDGNYLLYNEISNETESSEVIEEYGNSRFGLMKKVHENMEFLMNPERQC